MTAQDILANLLDVHELDLMEYKGWLFVNETTPAISANIQNIKEYDGGVSLRLDIGVLLDKNKIIWESFAGVGKDELSATQDAFHNFSLNSFHVFLSAFWEINSEEHVGVEKWEIDGKLWEVHIGNFGCKGDYNTPENLFSVIEEEIKAEKLEEDINWFRIYYANTGNNEPLLEVLKNNEVWNMNTEKIMNLDWKKSNNFYSLRNFILIKRI